MTTEIWKDIDGYEGKYQVSNLGNVKSMNFNKSGLPKILKLIISFKGYYVVGLHLKKQKMVSVHRLIAQAFIPNPENKPCINHKNGIKTDNSIENLEWCTHSENILHAFSTGLKFHTENNNFIRKKFLKNKT